MLTFSCSISKLNGVHLTRIIISLNVSMLIIGRTLGANLIFLAINVINFAKIGNHLFLLQNIKMDVLIRLLAYSPMAGKSKNIIQYSIKQNNVMRQFKTLKVIKSRRPTRNLNKKVIKNVHEVRNALISIQTSIVDSQ